MNVPMIVEYLSTRYRYFDSVETERGDAFDGIKIKARHGNFIFTNIMPGSLRDARAVEEWLDGFIRDFDRRYRDHRFRENNKEWPKVNPYLNFNRNITIKNVIFNNPATIVLWTDGTKTVVKCQNDEIFDPEKGLAMAIAKKAFGNKGNYCNKIKKWTEKYEADEIIDVQEIKFDGKTIIREAIDKVQEHFDRTFTPGAPKEV